MKDQIMRRLFLKLAVLNFLLTTSCKTRQLESDQSSIINKPKHCPSCSFDIYWSTETIPKIAKSESGADMCWYGLTVRTINLRLHEYTMNLDWIFAYDREVQVWKLNHLEAQKKETRWGPNSKYLGEFAVVTKESTEKRIADIDSNGIPRNSDPLSRLKYKLAKNSNIITRAPVNSDKLSETAGEKNINERRKVLPRPSDIGSDVGPALAKPFLWLGRGISWVATYPFIKEPDADTKESQELLSQEVANRYSVKEGNINYLVSAMRAEKTRSTEAEGSCYAANSNYLASEVEKNAEILNAYLKNYALKNRIFVLNPADE
jgi:hypothetical protein